MLDMSESCWAILAARHVLQLRFTFITFEGLGNGYGTSEVGPSALG